MISLQSPLKLSVAFAPKSPILTAGWQEYPIANLENLSYIVAPGRSQVTAVDSASSRSVIASNTSVVNLC